MTEAIKFSEWLDKLCGIFVKMHYLNHRKLDLYKQIDKEKLRKRPSKEILNFLNNQIVEIQRNVDTLNENRYETWNEIEKIIAKIMKGNYKPQIKEVRTYGR